MLIDGGVENRELSGCMDTCVDIILRLYQVICAFA